MAKENELMTAGAIAKELNVSPAIVSKTIKSLNLQPTAKKGVCSYYSKDVLKQIKSTLKK